MEEPSPHKIRVEPDHNLFNRYRWTVLEWGTIRHESKMNFATVREAQAEAEKFVEKLIITWQKNN